LLAPERSAAAAAPMSASVSRRRSMVAFTLPMVEYTRTLCCSRLRENATRHALPLGALFTDWDFPDTGPARSNRCRRGRRSPKKPGPATIQTVIVAGPGFSPLSLQTGRERRESNTIPGLPCWADGRPYARGSDARAEVARTTGLPGGILAFAAQG
jgi:hypothetical protein